MDDEYAFQRKRPSGFAGKTPYKHKRPFCIAKQHTPLPKAYIYLIQCVIGLLTRAVQNCFNAQNRAFSMDESINDRLSPSILSFRHTVPGSVPDSHRIPSFLCRDNPCGTKSQHSIFNLRGSWKFIDLHKPLRIIA